MFAGCQATWSDARATRDWCSMSRPESPVSDPRRSDSPMVNQRASVTQVVSLFRRNVNVIATLTLRTINVTMFVQYPIRPYCWFQVREMRARLGWHVEEAAHQGLRVICESCSC